MDTANHDHRCQCSACHALSMSIASEAATRRQKRFRPKRKCGECGKSISSGSFCSTMCEAAACGVQTSAPGPVDELGRALDWDKGDI